MELRTTAEDRALFEGGLAPDPLAQESAHVPPAMARAILADLDTALARVAELEAHVEALERKCRAYEEALTEERRKANQSQDEWVRTRKREVALLEDVERLKARAARLEAATDAS